MVRVTKSHRCCRCMPFLIITLVASFVWFQFLKFVDWRPVPILNELELCIPVWLYLSPWLEDAFLSSTFKSCSSFNYHNKGWRIPRWLLILSKNSFFLLHERFYLVFIFTFLSRYSSIPKFSIHFHLLILPTISHTDKVKEVFLKNFI